MRIVLRAQKHPDSLYGTIEEFDLTEIKCMPNDDWLKQRMDEFDYWSSFENHGMIYPITVSPHTEDWVQGIVKQTVNGKYKKPQHIKANGEVRPGLYVQTGNKRVYWAREKGYTHIEGYLVTNKEIKSKIRSELHIPHDKAPR